MSATKFRARIARTGTQKYESGDEYRDASEVFCPKSLATLDNVKVTIGHTDMTPVGRVVPGSHGRVTGPDGELYLTAELQIDCAATVARIRAGELRGISMGYAVEHVLRNGVKHQTQIRFDHCALLRRGVDQPRCGNHCSVHDRQDQMPIRYSDAIQLDAEACSCSTKERQDQRDLIDAWLDIASEDHGVHRSAILAEAARVHGDQVHVTKELIRDAALRLSTPGSYTIDGTRNQDAVFHRPNRADMARPLSLDSDEAFRAHLAQVAKNDTADSDDAAADSDDDGSEAAFSARLAKIARGGAL